MDLSECAREPIHIPGRIQSHGVLLACRAADRVVVAASSNAKDVLGEPAEALLGRRLEGWPEGEGRQYQPTFEWAGRTFSAVTHRQGELLILELEPASGDTSVRLLTDLSDQLARLRHSRDLGDLFETALALVQEATGFDRVMVYRFHPDWHGEVIAERRQPHQEAYLGLHYPSTDIPEQARELYRRSRLRLIADVDDQGAALISSLDHPVDLSLSVLRSVSPVHLQYLRNMGVGASMSISLLRESQLWGLIACHHESPRRVSHGQRLVCEVLAETLSLAAGAIEERSSLTWEAALSVKLTELVQAFDAERRWSDLAPALGGLVDCDGAALVSEGVVTAHGATPSVDEVARLATLQAPLTTASLGDSSDSRACGVLLRRLPSGESLLWFRTETLATVRWAGDPRKPAEDPLTPRNSFREWVEQVKGQSRPWSEREAAAADQATELLGKLRLKHRLEEANQELERFAHVVSHDLQEPLRGLKRMTEFLLEDYGSQFDARGTEMFERLGRLSERLRQQVVGIGRYARFGQAELELDWVPVGEVVQESLDALAVRIEETGARIEVGELPVVRCDRALLLEALVNLVGNALKYAGESPPRIEIGATGSELWVKDQGIGIALEDQPHVFDFFRRLHPSEAFGGGSGVGLAVVKQIAERHGGTARVESSPGQGATFFLEVGPTR